MRDLCGHYERAALLVAVVLPVVLFFGVTERFRISIPLLDDYDAVLGFLLRLREVHGAWAKLIVCVTDQQAEYKFILLHVAAALDLRVLGHLSLGVLAVAGNLLLLPMLYVLAVNLFPGTTWGERLPLLLPAAYVTGQLSYAELLNWGTASLNAFAVVAFSLVTLHLLVARSGPAAGAAAGRAAGLAAGQDAGQDAGLDAGLRAGNGAGPRRGLPTIDSRRGGGLRVAGACCAFATACAASTNGFFLAPIGCVLLWQARRYRAMAAWCVGTVAVLGVYLFRYQHYVHVPGPAMGARLLFFFSFLGGAVENMHRQPVHGAAIVLGVAMTTVFALALRSGYARRNPFTVAMATWILLTAVTVAALRSSMGLPQSLSGRYKLYCTLMLVFCYGYAVERVRGSARLQAGQRRWLWWAAVAGSMLFYAGGTAAGYQFLSRRHDLLVTGLRHYEADPARNSPVYVPGTPPEATAALGEQAREVLSAVIARGIYRPPVVAAEPAGR